MENDEEHDKILDIFADNFSDFQVKMKILIIVTMILKVKKTRRIKKMLK